jgi:undecaprenyl-diphosphatase
VTAELQLLATINDFARSTPWLHLPVLLLSTYATVVYVVLWVGMWWVARQQAGPRAMAAALWAPIGVVAASLVAQPVSHLVDERRPCRELSNIEAIGKCGKGASFPSDHAVAAGAVAVGLLLVSRRLLAWIGVLAALLIAFSRLYLGVHYPHDVLAGLVLGAVVSLVGWLVLRVVLTRIVAGLGRTRLRPLFSSAPARVAVPA